MVSATSTWAAIAARAWPVLLVLLGACATAPGRGVESGSPALAFGVADDGAREGPKVDARLLGRGLTERWTRTVTVRSYKSHDALAAALAAGEVDAAWMEASALVMAQSQDPLVTALAKVVRRGWPFHRGVIFSRRGPGAPADRLSFAGRRVAWVSPTSAAGYLVPRAELRQQGLEPEQLFSKETFAGDHEAVCRAVRDGRADLGATYADERAGGEALQVDGCRRALGEESAAQLQILLTSRPIPNEVVAVRAGLDRREVERLRALLLSLAPADPLMRDGFKGDAFVELGADDFDAVRDALSAAPDR